MSEHFRDPDLNEFVIRFFTIVVTAVIIVVCVLGLEPNLPLVAGLVSIILAIGGYVWRYFTPVISGSTYFQMFIVGLQDGLIGGGATGVVVLLLKFLIQSF